MNKKIPRPDPQQPQETQLTIRGVGSRSIWPLPPVGEAQRRNPYIGDPVPGLNRPPASYEQLSPEVKHIGNFHSGGGGTYTGLPPSANYVKFLGPIMQRSLGRQQVSAGIDEIA